MKNILFTSLLLATAFLFNSCTADESSPRVNPHDIPDDIKAKGEAVWNTTFTDLEGNAVKLSDYEGKVVLVDFWETWCGPCLQVFPAMDSLKSNYPEDFVVLAVNLQGSDNPEDVSNFAGKNDYNFEFLLDANRVGPDVIDLGIPFKMYFDPAGYVVKAELGTAGSLEADYEASRKVVEEYKLTAE